MNEDEIPMDETPIIENKVEVINNKEIYKKQKEIVKLIISKMDDPEIYLENNNNERFYIYKKGKGFFKRIFAFVFQINDNIFQINFTNLDRIWINLYDESYLDKLKDALKDINEIYDKRIYIE